MPLVFTINTEKMTEMTNESMPVLVGKVHADDMDLPPFNAVNYYLLPYCKFGPTHNKK